MSEALQPVPAVVQAKNEVEFIPFGSEDKIKLSVSVIRSYIAVPTRDGELPDERDAMKFLMLCRSRRLNPFEGDAFLIGFKRRDAPKAEWSLITAHSAFMKRAEIHPEFDGMESGIIIQDSEDRIIEREGDFTHEGDKLLGGWATVHFKTRKHPMKKKVKLSTYAKSFGVWVTDPAGMISKVAEVHALRDSFPTMLGGMMLREEYIDVPAEVVAAPERRPQFTKGLPAPDIGIQQAKPTKPPVKPPGAVPTASEPAKAPVTPLEASKPVEPPATLVPEPNQGGVAPEEEAELAAMGLAPEFENGPKSEQQAEKQGEKGEFVPNPNESAGLQGVRRLMHDSDVTDAQLLKWAVKNKLAKDGQKIADLQEAKLVSIEKSWAVILPKIQAIQ